jgi:RNA polymerase sigma-70 factor, ECF subfamily
MVTRCSCRLAPARSRRSGAATTSCVGHRPTAPQWGRGVFGADNVGRLLATMVPAFVRIGVVVEPHAVNGQPGAVFRDRGGKVVNTMALDVLGGRIQTIRAVINPDKLRHVGPVADAWAVARELNQARRPTD